MRNNTQVLIITGSAGTGKTTSIRKIIENLNHDEIPYYLLAPTGRAAQNLWNHVGDIAQVACQTIHSFLYQPSESDKNSEDIIRFDIKDLPIDSNAVVIIDEASMLSHETTGDADYLQFGTNNLFDDLLAYLQLNQSARKLILIGDTCQLPPINISKSEVLNPEFIQSKNLTIQHLHLTQVFRQQNDSHLFSNIIQLRENLENNNFLKLPILPDNKEIITLSSDEAIEKYLWQMKNSIFIAHSNQTVQEINLTVRELCGLSPQQLEKKEVLMLVKNSLHQEKRYYNGDMFIVESVGKEESYSYDIKDIDNKIVKVYLNFLEVELTHKITGQYLNTKILANKLWDDKPQPTREEIIALMINFRQRNPNLTQGTSEYRRAIRQDSYFNAFFMRFGYALTCHKAQGGEWENVFINLYRTNNDLKTKGGFTWLYTALTRASNTAYLIDLPIQKDFNSLQPFEYFALEVQQKLQQYGYDMIEQKPLEYELQLFIRKNNVTTGFKFYRNKTMKITRLMCMKPTNHTQELEQILNPFCGKSLLEE